MVRIVSFLGGNQVAGRKMKSIYGWEAWCTPDVYGELTCLNPTANTNESGFSALSGGFLDFSSNQNPNERFLRFRMATSFWSKISNENYAGTPALASNHDNFYENFIYWPERQNYGRYVRCVSND